jgi:hypothetical protein
MRRDELGESRGELGELGELGGKLQDYIGPEEVTDRETSTSCELK